MLLTFLQRIRFVALKTSRDLLIDFVKISVAVTNKMFCAKMMCDLEHFCKKKNHHNICSDIAKKANF